MSATAITYFSHPGEKYGAPPFLACYKPGAHSVELYWEGMRVPFDLIYVFSHETGKLEVDVHDDYILSTLVNDWYRSGGSTPAERAAELINIHENTYDWG